MALASIAASLPGGYAASAHAQTPTVFNNSDSLHHAAQAWLDDPAEAEAKYGTISDWNTSRVSSMGHLFNGVSSFSANLSHWDVSRVTRMDGMFNGASAFNADLSRWNVHKVTRMDGMFSGARSFDANISKWDVSKVTQMGGMFKYASSFDADLSAWNMSHVTRMDGMFNGAIAFNADLSRWNVHMVTRMDGMFKDASSFEANISKWDVSKVTQMSGMFKYASSFDADLSAWNVGRVTQMDGMFNGAGVCDADLTAWNVSRVQSMRRMFQGAANLKSADLSSWRPVKAASKAYMFAQSESLETVRLPTTGLTSLDDGMFWNCKSLNDVWIPDGVKIIADLVFQGCTTLKTYSIPRSVTNISPSAFGSTFCCPSDSSSSCNIEAGGATCDCKDCGGSRTTWPDRSTKTPPTSTIVIPTRAPNHDGQANRNVALHVMIALVVVVSLTGAAIFAVYRGQNERLKREIELAKSPAGQSLSACYVDETGGLLERYGDP